MKKVLALFAVLFAISVLFVACGGSKSSGPGEATLTSPQQAASSSSTAIGMAQGGVSAVSGSMNLTSLSGTGSGYQAKMFRQIDRLAAKGRATTDPKIVAMRDKVAAFKKSPTYRKTMAKANSFKTAKKASGTASINCPTSGTIDIQYSNNSDVSTDTVSTWNITITFKHCQDNSDWSDIDGTLTDQGQSPRNSSASSGSDQENFGFNVDMKTYNGSFSGSVTDDVAINVTESYTDSWSTPDNWVTGSGNMSDALNGTFSVVYSDPSNSANSMTYKETVSNLSESASISWTTDSATGNETDTFNITLNGSDTSELTFADPNLAQYNPITMSVGFSGLSLKDVTVYNSSYSWLSDDVSINGTLTLSFLPTTIFGSECVNGAYTFATTTAIHTTPASYCPTAGVLTVNGATITFNSNGSATLTLADGTTTNYATCSDLETAASACNAP